MVGIDETQDIDEFVRMVNRGGFSMAKSKRFSILGRIVFFIRFNLETKMVYKKMTQSSGLRHFLGLWIFY